MTPLGGAGTANQPFGLTLVANGLIPYDETSLTSALNAAQAQGTDSDGDGVGDIAELKAGGDPNVGTGPPNPNAIPPPVYGCSAGLGSGASSLLALAALLHHRVRPRPPRPGAGAR